MAKYTEFCNEVIKNVGGKENISGVVHCMTRLRLNVKDKSKVNVEADEYYPTDHELPPLYRYQSAEP